MAKLLTLFALSIVAFAHVSVGTKPGLPDEPCSSPVSSQQLTQCLMHLNEHITSINQLDIYKLRIMAVPEQQHLQQCCKQLSLVQQQCQCDAIRKVFDQARKQGGRELQVVEKLVVKAARLPHDCGLRVKQCPIVTPRDDYYKYYMVV